MNDMKTCIQLSELFQRPLVLVDIETTGFKPGNSEMIEVAAIRIDEGRMSQTVSHLIQPRFHYISPTITRITGITNQDVEGKPFFSDMADELLALFADEAIFVAHNVKFDFSFIQHAYTDIDVDFSPTLFDTVRLSRTLYGQARKHSLESIIRYHNIPVKNRHRAHADALAMWQFMQIALQEKGSPAFEAALARQLTT